MKIQRTFPLIFLLLVMFLIYFFDLSQYLSFENLKKNRNALKEFVSAHSILAPLIYTTLYIVVAALSIPGAVFLTLSGGFLFPQPYSTLFTITGATLGATCLFLITQFALADILKKTAGPSIYRLQKGLEENTVSYLLFLRFVPLFPFWLVNLAPALFGVPLFTFFWTTLVGVSPGSFVFCQAGAGLNAIFDSGQEFSIGSILNSNMKIAVGALGVFSLMPLILKKLGLFPKNTPPSDLC